MKKFLSILLAFMMVFSSVSYAIPYAVGTMDTAAEMPEASYEAPVAEESASLSAVDTTEHGNLVVRFTFDNLTADTDYTAAIQSVDGTNRPNVVGAIGGVIGSGSHMNTTNVKVPFFFDGQDHSKTIANDTSKHSAIVAKDKGNGDKYLQLTGTGASTTFSIRDFNGGGLAKAGGHVIVTFDVLTTSTTTPIKNVNFRDTTAELSDKSGNKFNHVVYVDDTVTKGEWTTVAVSYDDTNDEAGAVTGSWNHTLNSDVNWIDICDSTANGEVLGIDNVTFWYVPAEVSFNVTHDVEGYLNNGTFTIGGGIKTIDEIRAILDPDDVFGKAGYYLAGLRDENDFYTEDVAFIESGKNYTAVWNKQNVLADFNFDKGSHTGFSSRASAGTVTPAYENGYAKLTLASARNIQLHIDHTFAAKSIGDIHIKLKADQTLAYHSNNIYYWGAPAFVSANLPEIGSDWKVVSLNEMKADALSTINADTITKIRWDISPATAITNTLYIDYIRVFGKASASDKNVLINLDGVDVDFNNFKVVVTPTTTVQDIIDQFDANGNDSIYFIKGFKTPDGTVLKAADLVYDYVNDQDTLTAVWKKQNLVSESYEFNTLSDVTALRSKAIRGNATKNAYHNDMTKFYTFHEADSAENVGYVTVNFLNPSDDPNSTATTASYLVQDIGINPYAGSIPAGSFKEFSMRVRFRGDVLNNVYSSYTPTNIRWPELYWFYNGGANNVSVVKTTNITGKVGEWMEFHYTAEELGVSSLDVSSLRIDFPDFMPSRAYMDIDYIRFIGAPANVATIDFGRDNVENVDINYTATTTVGDLISDIDIDGKEIVVGISASKGGAALSESTLISSLSNDDITLYAIWGPNPNIGEFGELVFEINFDNATTGSIAFGGGLRVLSVLGGKTGPKYASSPANFTMNNGSGTNYPALTTEIVEKANGDKYLKATTNATGNFNLFQIYTNNSSEYYVTDDGYLILTYDILWGDSAASAPHNIAYNRSQAAEVNDQNERFYVTKNGGWGSVVSTFDSSEIGKSGLGGNSQTMLTTGVNYIKIHSDGGVKAGETYGIDNIRLWWVPKTVNVTVDKGNNNYTTAQTFSVDPALETVTDLIAKVNTGNADISLAGLSLTEGGELLSSDALLSFAYETTLYPKWSMPAQVTVDMGDNTSATPVSMTYKGSNTIGDVLKKIYDQGDKKLLGLARTPGGAVLASTELIGTDSADVTLYAIWEDYEFLEGYGYEFNDGKLPYLSNVVVNNGDKNVTVQDGYATVELTAKSGYTGTWDTQFYLPISTNTNFNPDKYIPSGVVTAVAARVRIRGTGTASQTLTIQGRSDTTFNPANPSSAFIHWAKPGNAWSSGLTTYSYDYNTYFPEGIIDGRWFTLYLDATSDTKLNMYSNGVGYARFDFPCPMPSGTKIDVDYIRLVGDNDKLPTYDGLGEYGEKVLEINFDDCEAGSYSFPQNSNSISIDTLGAIFNPEFNAVNYSSKILLCQSGLTSEIVADANGGNYLKTTATSAGTGGYTYFRNFSSSATQILPFVEDDGYFVVTYDIKNESSASVPHTFRFNKANKIEHAADNFVVTENGDWDKVVLYFDKEINPEKVNNDTTLDSINGVDIIKWHNTSGVKVGETICIDNLTLWYVPKTVGVVIDNSAIGEEPTLIENYPTKGMTNEELKALLPAKEGVVFNGLSKTEGGELVYENRTSVSQMFYSVWAVDTTLTVDMGENTKLADMTFQIPAGSSIKVSDIEAKFIDHGDKIFKGLSLTDGGAKLSSTDLIYASESGAVTVYVLWEDQKVNGLYSVEFDGNKFGIIDDSDKLSSGKNSVYRSDAKDASGNAVPGNPNDAYVWNEEGYVTVNFVASDYAKAEASAKGLAATVYDAFFEIDTLYGDETYVPKGTLDKIAIRMRFRNMPETSAKYWDVAGKAEKSYNAASVVPYFFFTSESVSAFGNKQITLPAFSFATGSAYRDEWFTVYIDVNADSGFNLDENDLYSIRFDFPDVMPDGAAIDIDYIRFLGNEAGYEAPSSLEERTGIRITKDSDVDSNGVVKNGVRVLGEIGTLFGDSSTELGWMFTASARWDKSSGSDSRNWHELTMDLYDPSSSFIKVGYVRNNSEKLVGFFDGDDYYSQFAAVLYNIPVKNYRSSFIVRPFVKMNGVYAYGEPFEINFLEILEAAAASEEASEGVVNFNNECQAAYAAYLDANAAYNSDETNAQLATIMSSRSTVISNLVIPTNDVAPTVSGNIVSMRVWKDGALTTINVSTKNAYPALLDSNNMISEAYAEKPCVYYLSGGVYYIKSLGRATNASGDYVGVERNDASALEANVNANALFLSEISGDEITSPFQRLPIDDELTNGKDSFFIGDYATGKFDFTFQRANSTTRTISTGKTAIIGSDSKVVAKYNFPNGSTEWVSYSLTQLLKMGLDSSNANIADGIDFTNLTYVVSNNTTSTTGVNQREYEDLALLVGEVDVPTTVAASTTNFLAAKYNKVIVKTSVATSYVTVKFTRADGVSDSIKYYAYGSTADGGRLFDVDLYGMAKYHSTIKSLTVTASSGSITYSYLVEDPDYYSSADLASMNKSMIFQDMNYDNGFFVRDMDQKLKKDEYVNYKFASNGATPVWMIDPWYAYDYSGTKSQYELYTKASETATSISDEKGSKVVKFNGTKTSTYADGSSVTGDVLSMTLNARSIYNGKTHTQMQNAGMTYWPHLLIEQNTVICDIDKEATSAGADKIFLEMDIKMTDYTLDKDSYFESVGTKQLSFLLYSYLRPKASPNDRIWFGASLCSEGATQYPTWNRDTGGSAYIYCIPQEVVYQGIKNSFYQQIQDDITETSFSGSGTDSTSKDWVHISLDITPYIDIAIDWANREDAFGTGTLTRDDFYFDGVNIGFETHGNIDGTFEIANFNFVAYNEK